MQENKTQNNKPENKPFVHFWIYRRFRYLGKSCDGALQAKPEIPFPALPHHFHPLINHPFGHKNPVLYNHSTNRLHYSIKEGTLGMNKPKLAQVWKITKRMLELVRLVASLLSICFVLLGMAYQVLCVLLKLIGLEMSVLLSMEAVRYWEVGFIAFFCIMILDDLMLQKELQVFNSVLQNWTNPVNLVASILMVVLLPTDSAVWFVTPFLHAVLLYWGIRKTRIGTPEDTDPRSLTTSEWFGLSIQFGIAICAFLAWLHFQPDVTVVYVLMSLTSGILLTLPGLNRANRYTEIRHYLYFAIGVWSLLSALITIFSGPLSWFFQAITPAATVLMAVYQSLKIRRQHKIRYTGHNK